MTITGTSFTGAKKVTFGGKDENQNRWRPDTTYGNGEFLQCLADRSITPYIRTRDSIHRKNSPFSMQ